MSDNQSEFIIDKFIGSATHRATGVVIYFNGNEQKPSEVKVHVPEWLRPDTRKEHDKTAALLVEILRDAVKAFLEFNPPEI